MSTLEMASKQILESRSRRLPSYASSYTLRRKTAQGASASMFHAVCKPLDEEVTVKMIDLEWFLSSVDPLVHEIQTMSLSSHPNIVPFSTAFVSYQALWIVMPLVTAGTIHDLIHDVYPYGLPESLAVYILWSLLKATEYLHKNNQVHSDIKAANIFLDAKGNVMLSDCGIIAHLTEYNSGERQANVGTPSHMSPEVLRQTSDYGYKAEIWSIGITAIEIAQGMAPYSQCSAMSVFIKTLTKPTCSLDAQRSRSFSAKYKSFVESCLEVDPGERPTCTQLLQHPLFANGVEKPAEFEELMAQLPPIGSPCTGSEKLLHKEPCNFENTAVLSREEWDFNVDVRRAYSDVLTCEASSKDGTGGLTRSSSDSSGESQFEVEIEQYRDGENTADTPVFVEDKGETKRSTFMNHSSNYGGISVPSVIADARSISGQNNCSSISLPSSGDFDETVTNTLPLSVSQASDLHPRHMKDQVHCQLEAQSVIESAELSGSSITSSYNSLSIKHAPPVRSPTLQHSPITDLGSTSSNHLSVQQLQKSSPSQAGQVDSQAMLQTNASESRTHRVPQKRANTCRREQERRPWQKVGSISRSAIGACLRFLRLRPRRR